MGVKSDRSRHGGGSRSLSDRARVAVVAFLLLLTLAFSAWFYLRDITSFFFIGPFYLPVILACLWWGRKGTALAVLLSLSLVVLHFIEPGETPLWEDLLRVLALFLTGLVIGELSERQHRLMMEIDRQKKELEEFGRTVSHDLKGPLSTITGFTEIAMDAGLRGDEGLARECMGNVMKSAERLRESIDSLLALAESGTPGAALREVEADDVVKEVLADHAVDIFNRGVRVDFHQDLPRVRADPVKLRQVFSNLVSNSLKYAREDVPLRLEIGCSPGEGKAVFFVRDNGRGMEPDTLEEAFAPFKRLHPSGAPGSGLGLSIARSAVESWGGRIWAVSEPGVGTTFYFSAVTAAG